MPISPDAACLYIRMWHRHHGEPRGWKFCHGCADAGGILRGVAITGRPVARMLDDGLTLEVTRVATDGTFNAASMLYGAAARTTKDFGYHRAITYTQEGESGASLRAAGWRIAGHRKPRPGWDVPGRPRESHGRDGIARILWERICNQDAAPWVMPSRPDDAERAEVMPRGLWDEAS